MEKGGKAQAQERLIENGFKVPPFFICDETWSVDAILKSIDEKLPNASFFAVRSSARGEDSKTQSFAGHFYSAIGVEKQRVPDEVSKVLASFNNVPGAVVVQEFIPSDTAGVLFTDVDHKLVINATFGLCQPVVNGEACDEYVCDKSGAILSKSIQAKTATLFKEGKIVSEHRSEESLGAADIRELAKLGGTLQAFFGSPQDIEWCFKDGKLYVLQSRPITRQFIAATQEHFDSANIAESYSGIVLPLTCTFAKMVYEQVYKDLLRMSGVSKKKIESHSNIFEDLLGFFYGRMYYNMNNWYRMAEFVPGYRRNKQNFELMITSNVKEEVGTAIQPSALLTIFYPVIVAAKVVVYGVTSAWFIWSVAKHLRRLRDHNFEKLAYQQCIDLFEQLNKKLLRKWYITVENDFFVMTYLGVLKKMLGEKELQQVLIFPSKATQQVSALASLSKQMSEDKNVWRAVESENTDAFSLELQRHPKIQTDLQNYLQSFGGRFANELKLESIGVDEDPKKLLTVLKAYHMYQPKTVAPQLEIAQPFFRKIVMRIVLGKFKKYASRREEFRLLRSNTFAMARKLFRRMGKILADRGVIETPDDIFYLHLEEILEPTAEKNAGLSAKVLERKELYASFNDAAPPSHFSTINRQPPPTGGATKLGSNVLYGRPASSGVVKGRIKLFKDFSMPPSIDFDILVTSHTDPGWTSLIALSKGLIIEHGGVLSHASIVARELGIPAVIGASDALTMLHDNQIVEIDGSSGIIKIL
jgi:phosphohistidine swiveling domain-containing protein